jgi:hypothetical protein
MQGFGFSREDSDVGLCLNVATFFVTPCRRGEIAVRKQVLFGRTRVTAFAPAMG